MKLGEALPTRDQEHLETGRNPRFADQYTDYE